MDSFFKHLDEFESAFFSPVRRMSLFSPNTEIFEKDENLVVRTELPGVSKADVSVHATRDSLEIQGRKECLPTDSKIKMWTIQRDCGAFKSTIGLPLDIDPDNISAKLEDGLLTVTAKKLYPGSSKGSPVTIS